jgi:ABC-type bacteriocin/lantibiotic exporter with double-glycine peptidase domain
MWCLFHFIKCEQWNRLDSEDTPGIETTPVLLMLDSDTEAKQSEKIKSELIPNVLKYLGILAEYFFSSLFLYC